jgi:hypothetical protein
VPKGGHHVASHPPINKAARKAAFLRGLHFIRVPTGKLALSTRRRRQGIVARPRAGQIQLMANIVIAMPGPLPPDTVTIKRIPDISIGPSQTYNMSQHFSDPGSRISNSQVLNLNTSIATYSHPTLTGVAAGTMTGLVLEVTYQ